MRLFVTRLFSYLGINNAVFFNMFSQFTVFITAPVSLIMISKFVSSEMQGYYYTFFSILSIQSFLELGFSQCIVNVASHEFSSLEFTRKRALSGDKFYISRLFSLLKLSIFWYGAVSFLIAFFVSIFGFLFFDNQQQYGIDWKLPWFLLCLGAALNVLILPITSILEGCNQYLYIGKYRLYLRVISVVSIWVGLYNGLGLYSLAISSLLSFLYSVIINFIYWFDFFKQFIKFKIEHVVSWKKDILPLQWRLALGWICGYFIFSLFNPVLFAFQGAVVAGKMGMTWSLISVINSFANTVNGTKSAEYGMLVSKNDFTKLDKLYASSTKQSILIATLFSFLFLFIFLFIKEYFTIGNRFLDFPEIIVLLFSVIINQIIFSQNIYFMAHKKFPFLWGFLLNAFLTSISIILAGKYLNVFYVCLSYALLLFMSSILSTRIFNSFKVKYHNT